MVQRNPTMTDLPEIESDSKWRAVEFNRCITDFYRTIRFKNAVEQSQLARIKDWLLNDNCPGWTGIQFWKNSDGSYEFKTTWDSSG